MMLHRREDGQVRKLGKAILAGGAKAGRWFVAVRAASAVLLVVALSAGIAESRHGMRLKRIGWQSWKRRNRQGQQSKDSVWILPRLSGRIHDQPQPIVSIPSSPCDQFRVRKVQSIRMRWRVYTAHSGPWGYDLFGCLKANELTAARTPILDAAPSRLRSAWNTTRDSHDGREDGLEGWCTICASKRESMCMTLRLA